MERGQAAEKIRGTKTGTKPVICGGNGGVSGKVGWVMSPTSYRAAPPRNESLRDNLNHSAIPGKGSVSKAAHSAHHAPNAWDQTWDQDAPGAQRPAAGRPLPSQSSYSGNSNNSRLQFRGPQNADTARVPRPGKSEWRVKSPPGSAIPSPHPIKELSHDALEIETVRPETAIQPEGFPGPGGAQRHDQASTGGQSAAEAHAQGHPDHAEAGASPLITSPCPPSRGRGLKQDGPLMVVDHALGLPRTPSNRLCKGGKRLSGIQAAGLTGRKAARDQGSIPFKERGLPRYMATAKVQTRATQSPLPTPYQETAP